MGLEEDPEHPGAVAGSIFVAVAVSSPDFLVLNPFLIHVIDICWLLGLLRISGVAQRSSESTGTNILEMMDDGRSKIESIVEIQGDD